MTSTSSAPLSDRVQPFGTEADHAEMIRIITSAARHEVVRCAALFSLADHLADGPKTADAIARLENLNPDATLRLMRACTSFGLMLYDKENGFSAMPLLNTLRRDDPQSMRHSILSWIGPAYQLPRAYLDEAIRTGTPQVEKALGSSVWGYYNTPRGLEEGRSLMYSLKLLSEAFAKEARSLIPVRSHDLVLDLGGGSGTLVLELLEANPEARGGVLELEEVAHAAERAAAERGLQERFTAFTGDFLKEVPKADLYLLKLVLHDWPEEACLTLLRNCRRSLNAGGRLFLIEQVLDETMPSDLASYLDLTMLVAFGGRERTFEEYAGLLAAGGFRVAGMKPAETFPYAVIEAAAL